MISYVENIHSVFGVCMEIVSYISLASLFWNSIVLASFVFSSYYSRSQKLVVRTGQATDIMTLDRAQMLWQLPEAAFTLFYVSDGTE